jgi:hypothetical protein
MATKKSKKHINVRDLKPRKDAKGGSAVSGAATGAATGAVTGAVTNSKNINRTNLN